MQTTIHLTRNSTGWVETTPEQAQITHYARWKPLTYGLWRRCQGETQNRDELYYSCEVEQELNFWRLGLEESSLGNYTDVLQFRPAIVPKALYYQYLSSTWISPAEKNTLRKQAYLLWLSDHSSLTNPHPVLVKLSQAMSFKENFSVNLLGDPQDILLRDYHLLIQALDFYYEVQQAKVTKSRLQQEASQRGNAPPRYSRPYDLQ